MSETAMTSGDLCPHCGQPMPVPEPQEAVTEETVQVCAVCGRPLENGMTCDRPDCLRMAAQKLHQAAMNTPFKLGI